MERVHETDLPIEGWRHQVRFSTGLINPEWPKEFVILLGRRSTEDPWSSAALSAEDIGLRDELDDLGRWHVRMVWSMPELGESAPAWAVEMCAEEGQELGLRYGKDAIYVVRGDALFLRYCEDGREEVAE